MAGDGGITIIKKKKVSGGDGHHGGAWKVAYADFVTAMMAFFLLMWLLNATTERQRKGIADYFTPTIAISPVSGGGSGLLQGDSPLAEDTLAHTGNGGVQAVVEDGTDKKSNTGPASQPKDEALANLETLLTGQSGESEVADELLSHIVTRVTEEGLVVDVFAKEGRPLFEAGSREPTQRMREILTMIGGVLSLVANDVQITGHTDAAPFADESYDNWRLSADRADAVRRLLTDRDVADARITRIVGEADTNLALPDQPLDPRNRRITLTILRNPTD